RPPPLKVHRDNRAPARYKDDLTRRQKIALVAGGIVLALLFVAVVVVALIRRASKKEVHPERGNPVLEKAPAEKKEPEPDPRRKAPDEGPTKCPPVSIHSRGSAASPFRRTASGPPSRRPIASVCGICRRQFRDDGSVEVGTELRSGSSC